MMNDAQADWTQKRHLTQWAKRFVQLQNSFLFDVVPTNVETVVESMDGSFDGKFLLLMMQTYLVKGIRYQKIHLCFPTICGKWERKNRRFQSLGK